MISIELGESDPLVWRRIVVPADYNLYQLHMAVQGAFGWENSHLFQFCEKDLTDPMGYVFQMILILTRRSSMQRRIK